jgi:hypothetical protein
MHGRYNRKERKPMGGKPSQGTRADKRLRVNKTKAVTTKPRVNAKSVVRPKLDIVVEDVEITEQYLYCGHVKGKNNDM